jgi:uncharacterized membrane protein
MIPNQNLSTKFRAALRNELPVWIQKGIISEQAAKQLLDAYQLDNLKHESTRLLSAVIFTIGGVLLGGGVISFVAANWEVIPTPIKLALLFFALISFHGFWREHRFGRADLSHQQQLVRWFRRVGFGFARNGLGRP